MMAKIGFSAIADTACFIAALLATMYIAKILVMEVVYKKMTRYIWNQECLNIVCAAVIMILEIINLTCNPYAEYLILICFLSIVVIQVSNRRAKWLRWTLLFTIILVWMILYPFQVQIKSNQYSMGKEEQPIKRYDSVKKQVWIVQENGFDKIEQIPANAVIEERVSNDQYLYHSKYMVVNRMENKNTLISLNHRSRRTMEEYIIDYNVFDPKTAAYWKVCRCFSIIILKQICK